MRLLAVNYHYYRQVRPASGIYPITPDQFSTQVGDLAQQWTLVGPSQVTASSPGSSLCVLTFDDGLKEQMQAARWLHDNGLTAVFFVSTAPIVNASVLSVHKLHMIRSVRDDALLASDLKSHFGDAFDKSDPEPATKQYRYDTLLAAKVKFFINFILNEAERSKWVSLLFTDLFGSEKTASVQLYMDGDDMRWLSERGMLGTHTHSHLPLATLDDAAIESEIGESLDILLKITGERVASVSYPYGGQEAVDDRVTKTAARLGLSFGFTMERGINLGMPNPLALKRISTSDVSEFAGRSN